MLDGMLKRSIDPLFVINGLRGASERRRVRVVVLAMNVLFENVAADCPRQSTDTNGTQMLALTFGYMRGSNRRSASGICYCRRRDGLIAKRDA